MICAVLRRYHLVLLWCASCQYVFVKVSGTDAVIRHRSLDDSIAKLESQNLSKVVSCPGIKLFLAQLCPSRLLVYILHCMEIGKKICLMITRKSGVKRNISSTIGSSTILSSQLNTICPCLTWITCLLQWWKSSLFQEKCKINVKNDIKRITNVQSTPSKTDTFGIGSKCPS